MTETDLFGKTRAVDVQGKCAHMNADYRLDCFAHVNLESTYGPKLDQCVEVERKISWSGNVTGKCRDCKKVLHYTASNMPKFIKRRLAKYEGLDELDGRNLI